MKLCLGKKVEFHETDESDVRKLHFGEYGVHCENGFWIISKAFDKRESGRIRPISKERVENLHEWTFQNKKMWIPKNHEKILESLMEHCNIFVKYIWLIGKSTVKLGVLFGIIQ